MAQENNNILNPLSGLFNKDWLTAKNKFMLIFKNINGIKLYLKNLNGYLKMGFPVQEVFELFQIQSEDNLTLSELILLNAAQNSDLIALYLKLLKNFLAKGLSVQVLGNLLKEKVISSDNKNLSLGYLMLEKGWYGGRLSSSRITYLSLIYQLFEKGFLINEIFNFLNIQTENGLHLGCLIFNEKDKASIDLYLTLLRKLLEGGVPAKSIIKLLNSKTSENKSLSNYLDWHDRCKCIAPYLQLVRQLLKDKDIFLEILTFIEINSNSQSIIDSISYAYWEVGNIQAGVILLNDLLELGAPAGAIFNAICKAGFNSSCIDMSCSMKISNEYFILLENLIKHGIAVERVASIIYNIRDTYSYNIINLTLSKFLIHQIGAHSNSSGQGIINYLIFVTQLCEKYKLPANKIKQTIAAKYTELSFINHLTEEMIKAKYNLSIQVQILYYLINNGFIPESDYSYAAKYKDHILANVLAFEEDKKLQTLLNALNPKHPLGKLFWTPRGLAKPDLKGGTLKKILSELNAMGYEYKETTNTGDFPLFSIKGAKGTLFSSTGTSQASTSLESISMLKPNFN